MIATADAQVQASSFRHSWKYGIRTFGSAFIAHARGRSSQAIAAAPSNPGCGCTTAKRRHPRHRLRVTALGFEAWRNAESLQLRQEQRHQAAAEDTRHPRRRAPAPCRRRRSRRRRRTTRSRACTCVASLGACGDVGRLQRPGRTVPAISRKRAMQVDQSAAADQRARWTRAEYAPRVVRRIATSSSAPGAKPTWPPSVASAIEWPPRTSSAATPRPVPGPRTAQVREPASAGAARCGPIGSRSSSRSSRTAIACATKSLTSSTASRPSASRSARPDTTQGWLVIRACRLRPARRRRRHRAGTYVVGLQVMPRCVGQRSVIRDRVSLDAVGESGAPAAGSASAKRTLVPPMSASRARSLTCGLALVQYVQYASGRCA